MFNLRRSSVLLVIATMLTTGGRITRSPEVVPRGTPHISVMTYNLLMTNVVAATSNAIAAANPDIVCMQETTARWDKFLVRKLGDRYPHRILGPHSDSWNGVSVLSKFPIHDVQVIPAQDEGWFESVMFTVDAPTGPMQILNVHLRPMIRHGSKIAGFFTVQPIHRRELQKLTSHFNPDLPHLIVGDFNEGNHGLATQWAVKSAKFSDALAEFDFDTPTWHGSILKLPLTSRLDHLMYSPQLHCFDAKVIRAGESDHYPVVGTFTTAALLPSEKH